MKPQQKAAPKILPIQEIIAWTSLAAKEHVELARFNGVEPDADGGTGLWQSFQARFPSKSFANGDYDLAVLVYSATYEETVKTLVGFRPDGGKKPTERCEHGKDKAFGNCSECMWAAKMAKPAPAVRCPICSALDGTSHDPTCSLYKGPKVAPTKARFCPHCSAIEGMEQHNPECPRAS
jgi:hypothetical protein